MDSEQKVIEIEIDSELLDAVRTVAKTKGLTAEELIDRIIDEFATKNLL